MPRRRPGRAFAGAACVTLAAALLGSSATAAAAPRHRVAATAHGFLDGVSCFSASNCAAVGQRAPAQGIGGSLAERWNGTTWSVMHTPNPGGSAGTRLTGVACPGPANCLAVGWYIDGASGDTLPTAEKWNGTSWSLLSVPDAPGSTDAPLDGVACSGTGNCFAVGDSMSKTFTEHWNGSAWSVQSTGSVSGTTFSSLDAVTCTSAGNCWATGELDTSSARDVLIEKWNGTSWSVTIS